MPWLQTKHVDDQTEIGFQCIVLGTDFFFGSITELNQKNLIMKNILPLIILLFALQPVLKAQECSKDLDLVNSLFEKISLEQALTDPDAIVAEFENLKSSLGNFSAMSLKKDTPKMLFLNGKEKKGAIKKGKKRVYVTSLVPKESLMITVSNPQQITKSNVIICAHNKTGKTENLICFEITEETVLDTMEFPLNDVKGKIISITINNHQSDEKLAFTIKADYIL